jgi:LPXTG-motif cell wall-anchored protein
MTRLLRSVVGAAALILIVAGTVPSADAAEVTQTVQGQYVRIVSRADWSTAAAMGPTASVQWDLVISARPPGPGTLHLGVSATGEAPVLADVRLCDAAWQGPTCPSGQRWLREDWAIPRDGRTIELDAMSADAVAHLRLDVRLGGGSTASGSTQVLVHAEGFGDEVQTGPVGSLPATGGSVPVVAIAGGVVLVVVASILVIVGRRRTGGDR